MNTILIDEDSISDTSDQFQHHIELEDGMITEDEYIIAGNRQIGTCYALNQLLCTVGENEGCTEVHVCTGTVFEENEACSEVQVHRLRESIVEMNDRDEGVINNASIEERAHCKC